MRRYLWNLLISFDQLANTIAGGDPDETISSRCGKTRDTSAISAVICCVLDWIDPGHVQRAIERDEGGDASL